MIQTRNLTKIYGGTAVVDDVSLDLPKAGLISIIGANGAGKSTLLGMISRLVPMDGGTVTVDGLDVATTPSHVLARRLSILRQDNHITSRLTVRDLVAFGRYPHSKGRPTPEDDIQVRRALSFLELEGLEDRFLDEISGGQRQRAHVAMVLCQNTDYVLLDEPLNNLDLKHAAAMMRLLRRMVDELDKTVVLVLHDINFASCHSNSIVAMRQGKILCQDTPDGIIRPTVLRDIYDVEMDVHAIHGKRIAIYF